MANIPQKNGLPVTTRQFSFRDLVLRQWNEEWNKPDLAYVFGGSIKKDNTDRTTTGIYKKP